MSYAQDLLLSFLRISVGVKDQYPSSPMTHLLYNRGSQSLVPRPATSASPNLLEMQIFWLHPDLQIRNSESKAQQSVSYQVAAEADAGSSTVCFGMLHRVFTPIVPTLARHQNPILNLGSLKTNTKRYPEPHLK